jgi:NitT/TauT family transport system substrate-binding protein
MTRTWTRLAGLGAALLAGALALPVAAKEKFTYAFQLDPMFEASMWALREGKVTSDIIDLELTVLPIPGLIQATTTKQFDAIQGDTLAVARAQGMGLDLVILATAIRYHPEGQGHHIFTTADSEMQDGSDLAGKRLAVASLGASGVHLQRYILAEKYGLDIAIPGGDVQFVETPVPAMIAGLQAGRFDAAATIYTQTFAARNDDSLRPLVETAKDMYETWGLQMVPSIVLSYPEKIAERPEAYAEFVRMLRESVLYMQENREEVYAAVAEAQDVDPEFFPTVFNSYSEFPGNLTENDRQAILKLWELAAEHGALPEVPELDQFIYENAVTE